MFDFFKKDNRKKSDSKDHGKYNKLTSEEKHIIEDKGTEMPFSGKYNDFWSEGTYICKKCNTPLYKSKDKFHSRCGWPSFDDAIEGRVKEIPVNGGDWSEITCNSCGGHLGHIFRGEQLTEKNTRHCVNSLSMKFIPEQLEESPMEMATLGGGCFWCTEATMNMLKGVTGVMPGYSGGNTENPTYDNVASRKSGHVECIQLTYDPKVISYKQLLEVFFTIHDPTTKNRQGNDVGPEYASVVFYHNDEQKKIAEELIEELNKRGIWENPIVTEVRKFEKFWTAEDYHHNYYDKNNWMPYCKVIIDPKITKMRAKWKHLLKETHE